jgi:hypothetical protein
MQLLKGLHKGMLGEGEHLEGADGAQLAHDAEDARTEGHDSLTVFVMVHIVFLIQGRHGPTTKASHDADQHLRLHTLRQERAALRCRTEVTLPFCARAPEWHGGGNYVECRVRAHAREEPANVRQFTRPPARQFGEMCDCKVGGYGS